MAKIKLAIVDDHEKLRNALTKLIHLESDLEVVLLAENGVQLLEMLKTVTPDIILMDIRMPKMDGIEASIKVKEQHPNIKIIAFSQYDHEANIIKMNIHGVKSFIGKNCDPDELFKAIRIVKDGGVYMTDISVGIIQGYLKRISKIIKCPVDLTQLEITILQGICKGMSSTDIAKIVHKSHRTVEKYRDGLYRKFNVCDKKQLISLVSESSFFKN